MSAINNIYLLKKPKRDFMKGFLLLIFTCQFALAQSINNDTLAPNQVDANGLKQGYWIVLNTVKKLPNYPAEAKVEEGKFTDSKKIGIWKTFFPGGNLKSEITFVNGFPKGRLVVYDSLFSRRVLAEGVFENGFFVPKKP